MTARYESHSAAAISAILAGGRTGVDAAAQELLSQSQALVPVLTGALRDSGTVSTAGDAASVQAAVSYSDPEAAIQHENMTYHHPGGGQAKYLEQPMVSNAAQFAQIIADGVHSEIGGAA